MNKIIVIGNLGKDPETRFTSSGQKVTTFSIATNKRRGDQDETIWYRVTVWGERFDKMIQYLKKGSVVFVCGELGLNKWTDASGKEKTSLEITADSINFVPSARPDFAKDGQTEEEAGFARSQSPKTASASAGAYTIAGRSNEVFAEQDEDPLPF